MRKRPVGSHPPAGVARIVETARGIAARAIFAASMVLGIVFIGLMRGYNVDLFGHLFGSVLAVTGEDIRVSLLLGAGVLLAVGLFFADRLYLLLLGLMALTILMSIKVVGIILVPALIVIPAAAAYQWAEDFRHMMVLSVLFGDVSGVTGLFLSYRLDTASGATMVLTATVVFFLSTLLSPGQGGIALLPEGDPRLAAPVEGCVRPPSGFASHEGEQVEGMGGA